MYLKLARNLANKLAKLKVKLHRAKGTRNNQKKGGKV